MSSPKRESLSDAEAGLGDGYWDKPYTLLLAPDDWLRRMEGGPRDNDGTAWLSDNLKAAQAPLKKAGNNAGCYEQALGTSASNLEEVIPFYFGETRNLWTRMKEYADSGSHISDIYSEIRRRGLFIFIRWRKMESKDAAFREESAVLKRLDFAANRKDNGDRRMTAIWERLGQNTQDDGSFGALGSCVDSLVDMAKMRIDDTAAEVVQNATDYAEETFGESAADAVRVAGDAARVELRRLVDKKGEVVGKVVKKKTHALLQQLGVVDPPKAKALADRTASAFGENLLTTGGASAAPAALTPSTGNAVTGALGSVSSVLPMANLAVGVANLGVGVYNAYQLHQALGKLDSLSSQVSDVVNGVARIELSTNRIEAGVERNSQMLCTLLDITLANNEQLKRLGDRLDEVERGMQDGFQRVSDEMTAKPINEAIILLERRIKESARELRGVDGRTWNAKANSRLTEAAELLNVKTIEALRNKPRGSPSRLGLVLIKAWAQRTYLDARLWNKRYWNSVRTATQRLREAQEQCYAATNGAIEKAQLCIAAGHDSEAEQVLALVEQLDDGAVEASTAWGEATAQRAELERLRADGMRSIESDIRAEAQSVLEELRDLLSTNTLYEISVTYRSVVCQYVHLHRGLLAGIEGLPPCEALDVEDLVPWDDGCGALRELESLVSSSLEPDDSRLHPMRTLAHLNWYCALEGSDPADFVPEEDLPAGGVPLAEIGDRLGLPSEVSTRLTTPEACRKLEVAALKAQDIRRTLFDRLEEAFAHEQARSDPQPWLQIMGDSTPESEYAAAQANERRRMAARAEEEAARAEEEAEEEARKARERTFLEAMAVETTECRNRALKLSSTCPRWVRDAVSGMVHPKCCYMYKGSHPVTHAHVTKHRLAMADLRVQDTGKSKLGLGCFFFSRGMGAAGAKAIAEALKVNSSLTELDLHINSIGDEGGKAIAEALKGNSSLTTLYLLSNSIGAEGGKAIAEALTVNSSLTWLNLESNSIGDEGGKAIAEALRVNSSLKMLNLLYNRMGSATEDTLTQNKRPQLTLYV